LCYLAGFPPGHPKCSYRTQSINCNCSNTQGLARVLSSYYTSLVLPQCRNVINTNRNNKQARILQHTINTYLVNIYRFQWLKCKIRSKSRAALTSRGPHTNVRRGPFSLTRTGTQDFLSRGAFSSPKKLTTFCLVVVVTFKPTLHVQTST